MDISTAFSTLESFTENDKNAKSALSCLRNELCPNSSQGKPPAKNELEGFVEHLAYERRMFENTFLLRVQKWEFYNKNSIEIDALLESFLLHARNLIEFLKPPKIDKCSGQRIGDGVNAEDYNQNWLLEKQEKKILERYAGFINKSLHHPSMERVRKTKRDNWEEVYTAIDRIWSRFISSLALDSYCLPWFEQCALTPPCK